MRLKYSFFMRPPARFQLAILFVICSSCALSAAQESKLAPAKRAQIEAAVSKFMASTHAAGIAVAVVENGEYAWSQGFGFADLENNVPTSGHSLFRLASISKSLTATAAMELWERGKLDLDAPIQKYCPTFPAKEWPISTRQVLGHLAGIRYYKSESQDDSEFGNTKHFDDPIQAGLNFFKDEPLLTQPGTSFQYSTQGYAVVGCVIEGASGEKYADFMRQNIFAPAHMEQTQVDDRFAIIPYRAHFYQQDKSGTVLNADFLDSSYKIPGGGWLSSAEDVARFEVAILNDKLIRRTTRDLMWTPLKPTDGKKDTYALGWHWEEQTDTTVANAGHNGSQQGTSTSFAIAPAQQAGVVVLINMEHLKANDLARELLTIVAGAPEKKP
ncbi:MAG: serine hydrolase domain-containing protein [Candidatus Sulfotelmatobacter sp.]|jgi:serine beta-lactamase-like protein LACTB